jgi:NADH-quinone oxidoreductase subunit G
MFSAIAGSYDLNNRVHSLWRDQAWRRFAVKSASVKPGDAVLDVACGTGDLTEIRAEFRRIGPWAGTRVESVSQSPDERPELTDGEVVVASWRPLLDRGVLQEGDPYLAATARPVVARLSAATAASVGANESVVVLTDAGSIELPVTITQMPDGVIWLAQNSEGSTIRTDLGVGTGDVVRISGGVA